MKFPSFVSSKSPGPAPGANTAALPLANDFVNVIVPGMRTQSVPVEDINSETLVIRRMAGIVLGTAAIFDFRNGYGHFRFTAHCRETNANYTIVAVPAEIREIERFGESPNRLATLVKVRWRYAPDGKGNGNFINDTMIGLNLEGGSLLFVRDLRPGTLIEVEIQLEGSETCTRIAKIRKMEKVQIESGTFKKKAAKFRGELEFVKDDLQESQKIDGFIAGCQLKEIRTNSSLKRSAMSRAAVSGS
jgi:hypothetical protein